MPPRRPSYDVLVAAVLAQARAFTTAAAAHDPAAPSRIDGWTVADLVAHVDRVLQWFTGRLAEPGARARPTLTVDSWASGAAANAAGIADAARQMSVDATGLAERVDAVERALAAAGPGHVVQARIGTLTLPDALVTRCIELGVHSLDLPEPAALDRSCAAIAVRALLDVLAARAPGRTVEVRVPPYGAVQCVEGPAHTRGTPPNTVECDPTTWLLVATGRLPWAEAVDAGRVVASGRRADLVAWLPLVS